MNLPRPTLTPDEIRSADELLKHHPPDVIARCWQDIASGEYGDDFDRRHVSFGYLGSKNRVGNWLSFHEAALGSLDLDLGTVRRV